LRAPTCFWGRQKLGNAIPGMIFCDGRRNNDERRFPKSSPKSYPPRYHGPAAAPKTQGGGQIDTRAQQDVPFPRAAVARVHCVCCVCCVRALRTTVPFVLTIRGYNLRAPPRGLHMAIFNCFVGVLSVFLGLYSLTLVRSTAPQARSLWIGLRPEGRKAPFGRP